MGLPEQFQIAKEVLLSNAQHNPRRASMVTKSAPNPPPAVGFNVLLCRSAPLLAAAAIAGLLKVIQHSTWRCRRVRDTRMKLNFYTSTGNHYGGLDKLVAVG